MDDPFAASGRVWHPALSEQHAIPFDVFFPLVDGFLQDERYVSWSLGHRPWQLHCFGSPGCGKTTFAAIVCDRLRRQYKGAAVPVTSIFIREDVPNDHASIIEDILASLYYQLCKNADTIDERAAQLASGYEKACQNGEASAERKKLLRKALHSQLSTQDHSFLILDGYDRLGAALRMLLDFELQDSHQLRLSVLITRRTPVYQRPTEDGFGCDSCRREGLKLYYQCQDCDFALCYECNDLEIACGKDGHDLSLLEPYPHIDLDINKPSESVHVNTNNTLSSKLHLFVARELEKEYGDLGLHSQSTDSSIPGFTSASSSDTAFGWKLLSFVIDESGRNLNVARLRLDEVYSMETFDDVDNVGDRLPRGIITFFNSEIERIKLQSPTQSSWVLMAIAAVAKYPSDIGMPIDELERWTRDERYRIPHMSFPPARSLEDVIISANGLLVVQPYNDVVRVALYHSALTSYVREDYNESLFQAKANLNQYNEVHEDAMMQDKKWNLAHITASPPTMSQEFKFSPDNTFRTSSSDSAYYSGNPSRNLSRRTTSNGSEMSIVAKSRGLSGSPHTWPASRPSLSFGERGTSFDEANSTRTISDGSYDQRSSKDTLCQLCREVVLGSEKTRGNHYNSFKELLAALPNHCTFCASLYRDILPTPDSVKTMELLRWPLFYWTVRSPGKLGNGKGSVSVSFRPVKYESRISQAQIQLNTKKYHLIPETELAYIPTEATLGISTDPLISGGEQLKSWIKTCEKTHSGCSKDPNDTFVPTRLVDLGLEDPNYVRVVETEPLGIKGPYLTLSHCWGKALLLTLRRDNEARLRGQGAHVSELPKNFREAIIVARFIGLRYIWIDSLCICQGKDGDFGQEGQLMHKVYRYSHCNIAIADSTDSKGGIFRPRDPSAIIPDQFSTNGSSAKLKESTWRIFPEDLWKSQLLESPIYKRGWVFQERLLSPRILHFAHSQMFWDCCTISATETIPSGLPHSLDKLASTDRHWRGRIQKISYPQKTPTVGVYDDSIERFWMSSVLNYTNCDLTNQVDKTFAIWSIAKIVRDVLDEEYGGGLWEYGLEEQLAWQIKECRADMRLDELQLFYPSWTWASMKGAVICHDRIPSERSYTVTNHQGGPISFRITSEHSNAARGDKRNNEPRLLEAKSIEMSGFVARGVLKVSEKPGSYTLEMLESDSLLQSTKPQKRDFGVIDVFPDETPSEDDTLSNQYDFMILAANEKRPNRVRILGPPSAINAKAIEDRLSKPDICESGSSTSTNTIRLEEGEITYSGIGLLLIRHDDYKRQQQCKLTTLRYDLSKREPGEPDLAHPSDKSLVDRVADLGKWVKELEDRDGKYGQDLHYHRLGAIQFRDVGIRTWKRMQGEGRVKFWLD
ncbi:HET-domain-containing protein [Melanomma pulvis-pyrius CBS 109.77]|uniref:HET-domain-containing protein n=1 Tax=Melanomma pulvis-pyrius CBS 109.77 TaxID=1314802 RepID=A0A6A6XUT9_9PLEO|nr:HET-domain-containing protein [Melanomma pulvis-pyrius CBS 109.77]